MGGGFERAPGKTSLAQTSATTSASTLVPGKRALTDAFMPVAPTGSGSPVQRRPADTGSDVPSASAEASSADAAVSDPGESAEALLEKHADGGSSEAPAVDNAQSPAPNWRDAARKYNQRHGLVEQFNAATSNACGSGADADPDAVAAWQTAHGIAPDGRIGPATLASATKSKAASDVHGVETPSVITAAPANPPASASTKPAESSAPAVPSPSNSSATAVKPTDTAAAPDHQPPTAHASAPAATPAGSADLPKRRVALQAEADKLLREFKAGHVDEGQAVQRFVAFDQRLGGGKMSPPGAELLAQLVTNLGVAAASATKRSATDTASTAKHSSADTSAATHTSSDASPAAAGATWTTPPGIKLSDPELLELAAKVRDPNLAKLLPDLAAVLALAKKLRASRDDTWEVHGPDREQLVQGIGVVRSELAALNASDPNALKFKIAVNHKLEEIAPYHFQLNIKSVESVGGWSTCNLTSLAMSLEAVGLNAANWKGNRQTLAAVAGVFKKDIEGDKETKNPGARLASRGRNAASIESLLGLRLPDFMELAAIVHALNGQEPTHDNVIKAAAFVVENKKYMSVLAGIVADFGASCSPANVKFDANRETNRTMTNKLSSYGDKHRGDHGKNQKVEHLNTVENLADREGNAAKKAEYAREATKLRESQNDALSGKDDNMEKSLPLDTYKAAVTRDLGKYLDEGSGVLAGLSGHWTRVYALDEKGVKVQDPGQWNRSEMFIPWEEARAMGYFWTNWVIK